MNETPAPSRRRGRPPKMKLEPLPVLDQSLDGVVVGPFQILAPPQEPVSTHSQSESVQAGPSLQAPTVPSPLPEPLPAVTADDVDLRETPAMAARHSIISSNSSGSDSNARGASDSYLPVEAGMAIHPNPALPEQSQALPVQERIPETSPINRELVPLTEAAPATPVQTNWTPVQVGDVVQINSSRNKFFGALFIIGDIKNRRVHGYQIGSGGKLEYFTVNEDEYILVGSMSKGQVRSRSGCSAKWKAEQR